MKVSDQRYMNRGCACWGVYAPLRAVVVAPAACKREMTAANASCPARTCDGDGRCTKLDAMSGVTRATACSGTSEGIVSTDRR